MAKASEINFTDRSQLKGWLANQPAKWAQVIAARAAMRVLPLAGTVFSHKRIHLKAKSQLCLTVFRETSISWAACKYPAQRMTAAAASAVDAGNFVVKAARVAYKAAATASFAALAVSDDRNADDAAVFAAGAAVDDAIDAYVTANIWGGVNRDAQALASGQKPQALISEPLWPGGTTVDWASEAWAAMQRDLLKLGEEWRVWITWYDDRLFGREADERLEISRARISEEIWKRGAKAVNGHIRSLRAKPSPLVQPNKKGRQRSRIEKPPEATLETSFLHDSPNPDIDYLNRADIAFVLAGRINTIWDTLNPRLKANQADPPSGFVVHVDAPWGGGKTSFTNFLARILNPYKEPGPVPNWLADLLKNEKNWPSGNRRPWHIVKFNAWQHQHISPPWWIFYETIRKQALEALVGETYAVPPEENVPAAPIGTFAYPNKLWRWWFAARGSIGERIWRVWTPDFRAKFAIAISVVGVIFGLWWRGWVTFNFVNPAEPAITSNAPAIISVLAVVIFGGGSILWTIISTITSSLLPGTPDAAKNYSLGSGDPLERFRRHFAATMRFLRRPILVVVDDLDRCEPSFVVELMRGMQTIFKSERVVYVLLGDRDWITHAFTSVNESMKGIDVGPEHEFGQRFVEKAIQFSFVLPEISMTERQHYVQRLLRPTAPPQTAPVAIGSGVEALRARASDLLKTGTDALAREVALAEIRADAINQNLDKQTRDSFFAELDRDSSLRAAADKTADEATRHRLEAISHVLPANPRQIKRIINTISLIQEVARLEEGVQPGDGRWQSLALWIVLMIEWPKTWYTISRNADLARLIHLKNLRKKTALVNAIKANKEAMALLDFKPDGKGSGWKTQKIDHKAVEWLVRVLPATSGEALAPANKRGSKKAEPAQGGAVPAP